MTYWGNYKYNYKKFQSISFWNSSLGKHVFGEKNPKKDNNLKCKVNTLVRYMLFESINQFKQVFQSLRKKKPFHKKVN